MDLTFYDQTGTPVAYTVDMEHIYLFSGEPVGYLHQESVYSYNGAHLGRFERGWIRDNDGAGVFFTEGAIGGPLRPMRQMKPMKNLRELRPLKSLRELRPMQPLSSMNWSELSGVHFFL